MLFKSSVLGLAVCALLTAAPAKAQYIGDEPPPALPVAPIGRESSGDALARNVRILAQSPRNFAALVGAGRAALATGDAEAAVGFFGRAADVSPAAPAPKAGMGAALAQMGDAAQALPLFDQAQRAGAPLISFAVDRGLARDLLGQQALAQADYRVALNGPDGIEARRRLALSQAISGDRAGALATLAPLRADPASNRTRAFVLALGGDADSADRALDATMPGMARQLDPFLRRLSSLAPAQKAAAVHLGIFPGSGVGPPADRIASAPLASQPAPSAYTATSRPGIAAPRAGTLTYGPPAALGDRLAGIDALLRAGEPAPSLSIPPPTASAVQPQLASASPPPPALTAIAARAPASRRVWVQLASGFDDRTLSAEYDRIAARDPELFKGIRPYVADVGGRAKLLVGPFHDSGDSATFIENLSDAHIDGFSWTSPEGQPVRKLFAP
ncbi:MAG: hypothetical protein ABIR77_08185 [Sphingomicrobium sp.]